MFKDIVLFFLISATVLWLQPYEYMALILSFVWTIVLIYRYGNKTVSNYLNTGIGEISNNLNKLLLQEKELEKKVKELSSIVERSEHFYSQTILNAKNEADTLIERTRMENSIALDRQRMKFKQVLQTLEDEYSILIKKKLTDLIIAKLTSKIRNPKNVHNIMLTDINKALDAISTLKNNI